MQIRWGVERDPLLRPEPCPSIPAPSSRTLGFVAIADGPDRDDGDGRDGEGGSAESRPSLAAEAPPGARRVTVDGIVVEVRNAAGLPTALSDQGAVELLARHQVRARGCPGLPRLCCPCNSASVCGT